VNIGFDAKRYFHNKSGLGNYSRDLVDSLIQLNPEHDFFLFDKSSKPSSERNKHIVSPNHSAFLWREFGIIKSIKECNIDVYHGLSNELPFGKWPNSIKKVVTIHDVIFKTHPDKYPFMDRLFYDTKTKNALKTADSIIATSQQTLNQMADFYQFDKSKVEIVYQTCAPELWFKKSELEIINFKSQYDLTEPFLLYVSSFNQRKNHLQLIKAFNKFNSQSIKLVFAGQKGDTYQSVIDLIHDLGLNDQIIIIPNFEQDDLPLLYQSAQAFVYPSLTEGFGIPLLEAMVSNLPILASDLPVFREVANRDVLFFDLKSESDLVLKLNQLMEMKPIDYSKHTKQFNKESVSKQIMKIYKQ
jgi:glycosyltransferase involved in cell wall biosynthesis